MKIRAALYVASALLLGACAWAQDAPKAELSFDYSFARYAPSASYTKGHSFNGGGGQFTYNFAQHFGIMMDLQGYNSNTTGFNIPASSQFPSGFNGNVSGNLFTYLFGPVFKFRTGRVDPYVNLLMGGAHSSVYGNLYQTLCQPTAGGCAVHSEPNGNGYAQAFGGGLDIPVNDRMDIRVGQFDWLYTRFTNQFNDGGQNNFRYLAGLNVKMGMPEMRMPTVACATEPGEVLPWAGPVKITATPAGFNPKHAVTYQWESSGGTAQGQGPTATLDTTSLAPGEYTVRANVTDPKQKKNNVATCTASVTVKQPRPPVVACSASPARVQPGEQIAITVSGSSPDLSAIDKHSFSATSGALKEGETQSGTQPGEFTQAATLDTSNVAPGTITINIGATDVHGLSSTCIATAEVVSPAAPPPPVPTAQAVGTCNFDDGRRPSRVNNECKAVLDGVALRMKQETDARLIIVGFADERGAAKNLQSYRAANVKHYLTQGDGKALLDPSRLEIRKSNDRNSGNAVQIYFVPRDAQAFQIENTDTIDETALPEKPTS